jgi:hypothetical protein
LDRSVLGEEPLLALKFSNAPWTLINVTRKPDPSEKRDRNCHILADSYWEMLLKAVRQPLGTAKRV